jgi:hypothetical protein
MSVYVPYISIRPSRLTFYEKYESAFLKKSLAKSENQVNLKNNRPDPKLSKKAARRIKDAIDWLLFISADKRAYSEKHGRYYKFKVTFITLTLASEQIHDDRVIKSKLLNSFLTLAKAKWKVKHYLWRAEPQKNGNIHFHIVTDKFIPWFELRSVWNRIQNKLGYVDRYQVKHRDMSFNEYLIRNPVNVKYSRSKRLTAYKNGKACGWSNPNSTDIHSIIRIGNLSAYLSKYCTKKNDGREIKGDLWRLSYTLSKMKGLVTAVFSDLESEVGEFIEKFKKSFKRYDYCSVLYVNIYEIFKLPSKVIQSLLQEYVIQHI